MDTTPWLFAAVLAASSSLASPGDAAFARGDFDAALHAYRTAVEVSPADFRAVLGIGTLDLYRGDLTEARAYLTKALQLEPDDARANGAMRGLHQVENAAGDFAVAIDRPEVDIPFYVTDPLPMIRAKINGQDARLIVDTGAPGLELTAAAAQRCGVSMHAAGEGVFAGGVRAQLLAGRVQSLDLADAAVRGIPAEQIPAAMPAELGGHPYDGVIGTNVLRRFLSTIDYPKERLVLRPHSESDRFEASARAHNDAIVPMWLVPDHFIFARARVNGSFDGLFSIDTGGAGIGMTLTTASLAAARIALDESKASTGVGGGGAVNIVPFTAGSVSLGSFTVQNVSGAYTPAGDPYGRFAFAVAGALSDRFFRTAALTFDFSAMELIVSRPG